MGESKRGGVLSSRGRTLTPRAPPPSAAFYPGPGSVDSSEGGARGPYSQPIGTETGQPVRAPRSFWRSACCRGDGMDESKRGGGRWALTAWRCRCASRFASLLRPRLGASGPVLTGRGGGWDSRRAHQREPCGWSVASPPPRDQVSGRFRGRKPGCGAPSGCAMGTVGVEGCCPPTPSSSLARHPSVRSQTQRRARKAVPGGAPVEGVGNMPRRLVRLRGSAPRPGWGSQS